MNYYSLFKALHFIAIVTWFAGLFYMFRIFVYHAENQDKQEVTNVLKVMAHKLFYYITTPSLVAVFVFGFLLLLQVPAYMHAKWFLIKFLLVMLLCIYHYFIGHTLERFKKDDIYLTSKQCRIFNEIPVLFLITIVVLAVFKPW